MLASDFHPQIVLKLKNAAGANIVVPKSVSKKAVDRNRIRRIIKEAQRAIGEKATGYTVIVRDNIAELKTEKVKEMLLKLIK